MPFVQRRSSHLYEGVYSLQALQTLGRWARGESEGLLNPTSSRSFARNAIADGILDFPTPAYSLAHHHPSVVYFSPNPLFPHWASSMGHTAVRSSQVNWQLRRAVSG